MKLFLLVLHISLIFTLPTTNIRSNIGDRIIGGQVAYSGQFTFAAAITKTTLNGNYFCGGTVLTEQWILTAGQCVDDARTFLIQLGSNYLDGTDPYLVKVSADIYVLHPEYDPLTLNNDIGAIRLRAPVEFSYYLQRIQLTYYDADPNMVLVAMGWGQISDSEPGIQNELRWVQVTALSNDECKIFYGNQITDSMICVDGNYNEGTCIGDSGSPLVQMIGHGYSMLMGVSSFVSQNGCESTDPSGFTRVFGYIDWIRNVTGSG